MDKKLITCQHCNGKIYSKDQLVTAFVLLSVISFHVECYSRALKSWAGILVSNEPINSFSGTATAAVTLMLSLYFLLGRPFQGSIIISLMLLIPSAVRFYSWISFERYLN